MGRHRAGLATGSSTMIDAIDLTRELSDYERVKRVYLLPREFSIDKGEMTPTLKIKRSVIDEKYEEAIDEICGS